MIGILDIGSNTIRLVTYQDGKKIENISRTSEILKDTVDKNLTELGTQKLCNTIKELKREAEKIQIWALATFAFRELENKEYVRDRIYRETGIFVEILSGREEAECDFLAIKREFRDEKGGTGVDLGGGSAQIFTFSENGMDFSSSYPIGCKKLKQKFVGGTFPNDEEMANIREYVNEAIGELYVPEGRLYMIGGTAKTALKMYGFLNAMNLFSIKTADISRLIKFIEDAPEDIMKNLLRARYDNIVVGIIIMEEIAKKCGATKIFVGKSSVRDGFMVKKEII